MSVECADCERDLRAGHAPDCKLARQRKDGPPLITLDEAEARYARILRGTYQRVGPFRSKPEELVKVLINTDSAIRRIQARCTHRRASGARARTLLYVGRGRTMQRVCTGCQKPIHRHAE